MAIDAVTLLDKVSHQMTFERKAYYKTTDHGEAIDPPTDSPPTQQPPTSTH